MCSALPLQELPCTGAGPPPPRVTRHVRAGSHRLGRQKKVAFCSQQGLTGGHDTDIVVQSTYA